MTEGSSKPGDPLRLERAAVRRHFSRASNTYDAAAQLQSTVRDELLDRCRWLSQGRAREARVVLDLGAGTGAALPALTATFPRAGLLAFDLAWPMVERARRQMRGEPSLLARLLAGGRSPPLAAAVCADAVALPLRAASVDVVFSSLMLQWCDDLDAALREVRRVLRPDGLFVFASFGPDTLRELRAAWAQVDSRPRVSRFIDMHDVGDALLRAGFAEPVLDVDRLTTSHADARALMRHLKDIGALNAAAGRGHALTGRRRFEAVCQAYPRAGKDAEVSATWEVVYGSAFAGAGLARTPGEFAIDAASLSPANRQRRGESR